jgi:hypothetical protein
MHAVGVPGEAVRSSKLLRRLESKQIIEEPPMSERPLLPSARKWGGKRGYHYVVKKSALVAFNFEGNSYRFLEESGKTYLYKINGNFKLQ